MALMIPRWGTLKRRLITQRQPVAIDDGSLRQIVAEYGLGEVLGRQRPMRGRRSQSIILDTPRGCKVLKQYKATLSVPSIQFEHEVLSHLAQVGFRVPRLLPSRGGSTLVTVNDRHYALFGFVDGFHYTDFYWHPRREREFLAEAGQVLADLHRVTDGFRPAKDSTNPDGFTTNGDRLWRDHRWYVAELQRCVAEIRSQPNRDGFGRFVLEQKGRLQCGLEELGARVEAHHPVLRKLVIHGDYGPYNLLFNSSGLAAVLDFECTRLDLRVYEVAFALFRFASARHGGLDLDKVRIFYTAYNTKFPLAPAEIDLVPDVLGLLCARGLAKMISRNAGERNELVLRLMRVWDWLTADSLPLRAVLRS